MATRADLPPLLQFEPLMDPSLLGQRWKNWVKWFKTYIVAANITDDKQKGAMVLYQVGPATQEIFETIPDTGDDFNTALTKLNDYFLQKRTSIMKSSNSDKLSKHLEKQSPSMLPD